MGRIDLQRIEPMAAQNTENILERHKFVANTPDLTSLYNLFNSTDDLINSNRVCYIYGYGSQPKSIYKKLSSDANNDYKIIWYGYNGPRKYKFLSYITASTSGLIDLKNKLVVKKLLETLSHLSMVGLFSLSKNFAFEFEKNIIKNVGNFEFSPENYISKDISFFYFIIDGDSYDTENDGFLCQMALGKQCPKSLFETLKYTNKKW